MMRTNGLVLRSSALPLLGGMLFGCNLIAGLEPAHLIEPDGGGTGGHTTTSTTGTGGGMQCTPGETMACYDGAAGTEGVGICHAGTKQCNPQGTGYGLCTGEVTPQPETCAGSADEDCSGHDCVTWAELFGAVGLQTATAVAADSSGNLYVGGSFFGSLILPDKTLVASGKGDAFLLKLDPSGKVLWGVSFGGAGATTSVTALAVDASGAVLVEGSVWLAPSSVGGATVPPGLFVAKLGADSTPAWTKSFGENNTATGARVAAGTIAVLSGGDVVLGGLFVQSDIDFGKGPLHNGGSKNNGFLARISGGDGSGIWSKGLCGGTDSCNLSNLTVGADDSVYVAGQFHGTASLGTGSTLISKGTQDLFVAKLQQDGTPEWGREIGGANSVGSVAALTLAGKDSLIVAGGLAGTMDFGGGGVTSPPSNLDSFVARYTLGNVFVGNVVVQSAPVSAAAGDADGNVFIGGTSQGAFYIGGTMFSAPAAAFVAKLASDGSVTWGRRYGDAYAQMEGLAVVAGGVPVLVGGSGGSAASIDFGTGALLTNDGADAFVVKLSP